MAAKIPPAMVISNKEGNENGQDAESSVPNCCAETLPSRTSEDGIHKFLESRNRKVVDHDCQSAKNHQRHCDHERITNSNQMSLVADFGCDRNKVLFHKINKFLYKISTTLYKGQVT